jgi:hypothetical protein
MTLVHLFLILLVTKRGPVPVGLDDASGASPIFKNERWFHGFQRFWKNLAES